MSGPQPTDRITDVPPSGANAEPLPSPMSLRCLIDDDEPLAHRRLRDLLDEADAEVNVVAEADGGLVFAHTTEGRYRTDFTPSELEEQLPEDGRFV